MFLDPPYYSWALSSLHHLYLTHILFPKVDPTWCPVLGVIAGCTGVVKSVGPPMSPSVALKFSFLCILVSCQFLRCWFLGVCMEL